MSAAEIVYINPTLADLPDGRCKTAFRFWLSAHGAGDLPAPEAIDVLIIPKSIVANASIYDVEDVGDGEKRFRFRFLGTAILGAIGFDPTGTYFDDVAGTGPLVGRLLECVNTRRPYFYQGPLFWRNIQIPVYRSLGLPFAKLDAPVTMVMAFAESYRSPTPRAEAAGEGES